MALCRKWASELDLPTRDMEYAAAVVHARMALEHPSAFMVVAADDDDAMCAYVCTPVGRDVHRVDAVVWGRGCIARPALQFAELRRWHDDTYPNTCLTSGSLRQNDLWAWDRSG